MSHVSHPGGEGGVCATLYFALSLPDAPSSWVKAGRCWDIPHGGALVGRLELRWAWAWRSPGRSKTHPGKWSGSNMRIGPAHLRVLWACITLARWLQPSGAVMGAVWACLMGAALGLPWWAKRGWGQPGSPDTTTLCTVKVKGKCKQWRWPAPLTPKSIIAVPTPSG